MCNNVMDMTASKAFFTPFLSLSAVFFPPLFSVCFETPLLSSSASLNAPSQQTRNVTH